VATATETVSRTGAGIRGADRVDRVTAFRGSMPPAPQNAAPDPLVADEPGLNHAFVAYRTELNGLARRALGSAQLAEEAVQETYIRAWRSRDRFDPSLGSLRTWLFSIERNLLIDMARTRRRVEVRDAALEQTAEPAVDDVESAMVSWQVEEAVGLLTPDHRAVIIELYFRGVTSREMAERTGVPEGTIRSRLFYALKALRLTLQEMGWSE
jgi:RNA polymerase sigma-70 factor (ECF subfamily)